LALKRIIPVVLTIIIATSFARYPEVRAASPKVEVSSVYNLTQSNITLLINITVNDVSDLSMWVIDFAWDPSMIQINTGDPTGILKKGVRYDIHEGPFLKSVRSTLFAANGINATGGKVSSLASGYTSTGDTASGSGTLATISFTVIKVGITRINMTGPSATQPGRSMLIDHFGKEIPHEDVEGVITTDGPPPPPPFWTQFWFQITAIIVIVAVVAAYIITKVVIPARERAKAREAEEIVEDEKAIQEEIEKGFR
jgi:hypothetical protein